MANVQKQFDQFHDAIKLDDNATLAEKRDIIVKRLKAKLKDKPTFSTFNQGSYAMHTGVKPLEEGQYDIDVAIFFDVSKDDYDNPVEPKLWVFNALQGHTEEVRIKEPCVTVTYKDNGVPRYHVDLPVYAATNPDGQTYLARGKQHSDEEHRRWEVADPKKLQEAIQNHLSKADDRAQFRRVIRYMKRWKDLKFAGIDKKPPGIGLTVAGLSHFTPKYTVDSFDNSRKYNDLDAVSYFVQSLIDAFDSIYRVGTRQWVKRLSVAVPVVPYTDIFEKMSDNQMADFLDKLKKLLAALQAAQSDVDPVSACQTLKKQFGDDFPVPDKSVTGEKKSRPSIISESSSA